MVQVAPECESKGEPVVQTLNPQPTSVVERHTIWV
jgi:hypothetical protein